jgi:hypothetical protein
MPRIFRRGIAEKQSRYLTRLALTVAEAFRRRLGTASAAARDDLCPALAKLIFKA